MGVKFEKNAYFRAFIAKIGSQNIGEYAKKHQEFNAGGPKYSEFNEGFKGKGWVGRKIAAVPKAAIAGVVKTAYHLAMAAIVGGLSAISDDGLTFKAYIFCVLRDVEEAAGWTITIVYDSFGQFLVQESLFYKSYYGCFAAEKSEGSSAVEKRGASPVALSPISPLSPIKLSPVPPSSPIKLSPVPPSSPIKLSPISPLSPLRSSPPKPEKPKKPKFELPYKVENELEKEFESIKKRSGDKKEQFIEFAGKCLEKGALEQGIKAMKELSGETERQEKYFVKAAEAYLKRGEIDKALDAAGKIYSNTKAKEDFYKEAADHCYQEGDLEKAIEAIKKIYSDTKTKEDFFAKTAQAYLDNGDKAKAVETIKSIYSDTKTKEAFLEKAGVAYMNEGDIEKGLEVLGGIYSNTKNKDAYLEKAANLYLKKGDKEKAVDTIKKIYGSSDVKDKFLVTIVEAYFKEGKYEKALDVNGGIYNDNANKELFIKKVAAAYLANGDKEKAVDTIKKIYHDTKAKEDFLKEIAETYFKAGNFKKTLDVIGNIYHDTEIKEGYFAKIANHYLNQGDRKNAIETIRKIYSHSEVKDTFAEKVSGLYFNEGNLKAAVETANIGSDTEGKIALICKIARIYIGKNQADEAYEAIRSIHNESEDIQDLNVQVILLYWKKNDEEGAIKSSIKIAYSALKKTLFAYGLQSQYYKIVIKNLGTKTFVDFMSSLAKDVLMNTKDVINGGDTKAISKALLNCINKTHVEAFLRFNPDYVPNSFEASAPPPQEVSFEEYYKTLGLPNKASKEDVKAAYKKLTRKHHPDMIRPVEGETVDNYQKRKLVNEEKFKTIAQAYEILMNL